MSGGSGRAYLREAIEFLVYFAYMTLVGAAMYVLVMLRPQAHSQVYINTSILVAFSTGAYAAYMYTRYRKALRRFGQRLIAQPPDDAPLVPAKPRRDTRAWAERVAQERIEAAGNNVPKLLALADFFGIDPEKAREATEGSGGADVEGDEAKLDALAAELAQAHDLDVDDIRAKIAERLQTAPKETEAP